MYYLVENQPTENRLRTLVSRRTFLRRTAAGMGTIALASLGAHNLEAGTPTSGQLGALESLHGTPKAKRVIFLVMAGGASHLQPPVRVGHLGSPMCDPNQPRHGAMNRKPRP